mmetsp:Transcript_16867/g.40320  ORF Transcript_16867/g.40320 Transcript_16867/m.40320 type:complete len:185 (-) Transcript_16867:99-653(-)
MTMRKLTTSNGCNAATIPPRCPAFCRGNRRTATPITNAAALSLLVAAVLLLVDTATVHGFSVIRSNYPHSGCHRWTSRARGVPSLAARTPPGRINNNVGSTKNAKKTLSQLHAKKKETENVAEEKDDDSNNKMMAVFKKSPGVAIVAPFVLVFGLDLVLNIAVVTKRSLEVFFTGEYTVWTPWQ